LKNRLLHTIGYLLILATANSQAVFYLNAGSRAPWGDNQQLTIHQSGQALFILREVNGRAKDSISFNIPADQLNSIFQKAREIGFFGLEKNYDSDAKDGWGIYISLNDQGNKYQVSVKNIVQPAIKEFVTFLNNLLSTRNIRIRYGD